MNNGPGRGTGQRVAIRVHLLLVGALTVLFVAALVADAPGSGQGANIGLGLLLIPTPVLGLPWSAGTYLLLYLDGISGRTPVLATLVLLAQLVPAWINLAAHRWITKTAERRRQSSPGTRDPGGPGPSPP